MAESNILLTRIDNRLIHGQVATQWNATLGASMIVVANNEVAQNTVRQNLMKIATPAGVQVRVLTLQHAIDGIGDISDKQKIFLLVETPEDALELVEGGVPITKVNIGNMHMSEGKRQVASSVAVDDVDVDVFRKLLDRGIELEIRRLPSTPPEDLARLFD